MPHLFLLRHAEAAPGSPDNERKLTDAGKAVARKLGLIMRERKFKPALVYCSPSRRTKETLEQLQLYSKVEYKDEIYGATPDGLFTVIRGAGTAESLLLVGHNPAIHGLASGLCGAGDDALIRNVQNSFPPATLAVFSFTGVWDKMLPAKVKLETLVLS